MHAHVVGTMPVQEFDGEGGDIPRGNPRRTKSDVDFRRREVDRLHAGQRLDVGTIPGVGFCRVLSHREFPPDVAREVVVVRLPPLALWVEEKSALQLRQKLGLGFAEEFSDVRQIDFTLFAERDDEGLLRSAGGQHGLAPLDGPFPEDGRLRRRVGVVVVVLQ